MFTFAQIDIGPLNSDEKLIWPLYFKSEIILLVWLTERGVKF